MTEPIPLERYLPAMEAALDLAREAGEAGDVPVGAVLLDPAGEVVGTDRNRREELRDPIAHAEMLVMSARAREIGDWRLMFLDRDRVREATVAGVQRAALAYLKPSNRTIGVDAAESMSMKRVSGLSPL